MELGWAKLVFKYYKSPLGEVGSDYKHLLSLMDLGGLEVKCLGKGKKKDSGTFH